MTYLSSSELTARNGICTAKHAACECEIKRLDATIKGNFSQ